MALEEDGGLTFSLDVGSDGATSLRTTIMKKLSEFMGSYTDDVLAEYVVVLVGHGKHRAQAVKDLEAFLGDQSEAFVTWLWDHLGSNIHLYTSASKESSPKFDSADPLGQDGNKELVKSMGTNAQFKEKSHEPIPSGTAEGGRLITLRRDVSKDSEIKSRKEMSMATLGTTQVDSSGGLTRGGGGFTRTVKRPRSPDSWAHTERIVSEKQKRHLSPPRVNATRRLLQSAVREAVAPVTGHSKRLVREAAGPTAGHSKRSESSLKRLQSVVSADVENSENASVQQPLKDLRRPDAIRQGKRAVPAMMMAMKAAAAAAEDATKARGRLTGNIWDRLGKKSAEFIDSKDEEHIRFGHEDKEAIESRFTSQREDEQDQKRRRLESDDVLSEGSIEDDAAVSGSVFDEYTGQSAGSRNVYAVRGGKYQEDERNDEGFASDDNAEEGEHMRASDRRKRSREESVTVEYRLARNTEGATKESHKQKGSSSSSGLANSSQKIVNISVNVNTWKPGAYEKVKDTGGTEQPTAFSIPSQSQEQLEKAAVANMISAPIRNELEEENAGDVHVTATKKQVREVQSEATNSLAKQPEIMKEVHKAVSSAVLAGAKQVRKPDDAESRTVFVTNIHFAATKESVMAHFVSCGDIGRIVMLTDGATGQPKGSAYIEFKTKDATDRALALNESSFYSRALKVVRKDAAIQAIQEMNPLIHPALIRRPIPLALRLPLRGRFLRGSPFLLPRRFPAMPRPYGNFPSLQWKRDTATTPSGSVNPLVSNGNRPGFNVPVRPTRSLSYVRSSNSPGTQPLKTGEELTAAPSQGEKDEMKSDVGRDFTREQKGDKEMGDVQMEQA